MVTQMDSPTAAVVSQLVEENVTMRRRRRNVAGSVVYHVLMATAVFVWLIPLIWMLSISFSTNEALRTNASSHIPVEFTFDNFRDAFAISLVGRWFLICVFFN